MTSATTTDRSALLITYVNIVLYALCYQLQRPVEPFLVQSLAASSDEKTVNHAYGRLNSFFSLIQTVGSPLVGILLDRIGIRRTSALVFAASALSYQILSHASNMNLLFLSKVPTALQHAFLVAQATAATSTGGDDAARAAALGRMTTAYTIGATIGPALGGFLVGDGDLYTGARMAVFGSLLSVVLSVVFLKDAAPATERDGSAGGMPPASGEDGDSPNPRSFAAEVRRSARILTRAHLWPLLLVKVVSGVASSMHHTALPLVLTRRLRFDPSELGMSMSASSLSIAAFGAVGIAPLISLVGSLGLARGGLLTRAFAVCALAALVSSSAMALGPSSDESAPAHTVLRVVGVSVFHALASHALATALTTQTTGSVSKSEQGALLGLEHGLFSVARVVGPSLGTTLLAAGGGGLWSVALACVAVDILLIGGLAYHASVALLSGKNAAKREDDIHSD